MKYPIGIQNFGEVRRGGYAYVDKTALMYKMLSEGKYYFLSRPRRFGKSLLLSTMEAFLEDYSATPTATTSTSGLQACITRSVF